MICVFWYCLKYFGLWDWNEDLINIMEFLKSLKNGVFSYWMFDSLKFYFFNKGKIWNFVLKLLIKIDLEVS